MLYNPLSMSPNCDLSWPNNYNMWTHSIYCDVYDDYLLAGIGSYGLDTSIFRNSLIWLQGSDQVIATLANTAKNPPYASNGYAQLVVECCSFIGHLVLSDTGSGELYGIRVGWHAESGSYSKPSFVARSDRISNILITEDSYGFIALRIPQNIGTYDKIQLVGDNWYMQVYTLVN